MLMKKNDENVALLSFAYNDNDLIWKIDAFVDDHVYILDRL